MEFDIRYRKPRAPQRRLHLPCYHLNECCGQTSRFSECEMRWKRHSGKNGRVVTIREPTSTAARGAKREAEASESSKKYCTEGNGLVLKSDTRLLAQTLFRQNSPSNLSMKSRVPSQPLNCNVRTSWRFRPRLKGRSMGASSLEIGRNRRLESMQELQGSKFSSLIVFSKTSQSRMSVEAHVEHPPRYLRPKRTRLIHGTDDC